MKLNSFDLGNSRLLVVDPVSGAFKAHLMACSGREIVLSTGVSKVKKYWVKLTIKANINDKHNNKDGVMWLRASKWTSGGTTVVPIHRWESRPYAFSIDTTCIQQSIMSGTEYMSKTSHWNVVGNLMKPLVILVINHCVVHRVSRDLLGKQAQWDQRWDVTWLNLSELFVTSSHSVVYRVFLNVVAGRDGVAWASRTVWS